MLRINKLTDYALNLLCLMAENPEHVYSANDMVFSSQNTLPTVSKIMKILTKGGLLTSVRGMQGGYKLSKKVID